ncbi:MAG: alpha/beta fold hydrolase [Cellvibrionales bacterium]|nr:alpha/beta fold hydrolase [Cellvibrionales bacterium]
MSAPLWRYIATLVLSFTTVWLLASVALLPPYALMIDDNPVTSTPADQGVTFEDIQVPSDELLLEGWWMPAENPRGVVLFAHGAGSNRTSTFVPSLEIYRALVDSGLSVVTVDFRNHGNSPKTDGKLGFGATEWRDMAAMATWLDGQGISTRPRIGMGVSMGGAVTLRAVAEGLAINKIILFDPALNLIDSLAQGGWVNFGLPAWIFSPMAWSAVNYFGLPSGQNDPIHIAGSLSIPTLIIQDPDDPVTRALYAKQVSEANPEITLALAPEIQSEDTCISGKGRWGSHAAAFKCHPSWTLSVLEQFLRDL